MWKNALQSSFIWHGKKKIGSLKIFFFYILSASFSKCLWYAKFSLHNAMRHIEQIAHFICEDSEA